MSAARVMFVEPPPTVDWQPDSGLSTGGRRHPSLSVTGEKVYSYLNLSSAAVLRERGHEVFYIHCQTEGVTLNALYDRISASSPDIVLIMVEHITINVTSEIARYIKQNTGCCLVFAGPMATAKDEEIMEIGCDYIIRGEWDYTLFNLADAIEANKEVSAVPGITYKQNGTILRTEDAEPIEDLDNLPFPAYDLIDLSKFFESIFVYSPVATTMSSRGCPSRCSYCVFPNTIFSHKFRAQSPERVVKEAEYLQDKFGVKLIRYDDDSFNIDTKRVRQICRLFKQKGLKVKWNAQCRPISMNYDLAREMKEAGCVLITFGIESGNNDILKKIHKGTRKEDIRTVIREVQKAGVEVHNCYMLGFLWDTEQTIKDTIDFAFELNSEFAQFSIATPLPGTEYYDLLKNGGYMKSEKWEDFDSFHHVNINYPYLDDDYVNRTLKDVYRRYYTRPRYILKMAIRTFKSIDHFKHALILIRSYLRRFKMGWI